MKSQLLVLVAIAACGGRPATSVPIAGEQPPMVSTPADPAPPALRLGNDVRPTRYGPRAAKIDGGPTVLAQSLAAIDVCIVQRERFAPGIAAFLKRF